MASWITTGRCWRHENPLARCAGGHGVNAGFHVRARGTAPAFASMLLRAQLAHSHYWGIALLFDHNTDTEGSLWNPRGYWPEKRKNYVKT